MTAVTVNDDESRIDVTYDGQGREIANDYGDGLVVETSYGRDVLFTEMSNPLSGTVTRRQTAAGNLAGWEHDGRPVVRYERDGNGRLSKSIDALGQETHYGYDAFGRIDEIRAPNDGVVRMERDAEGHVVAMRDPLNQLTTIGRYRDGSILSITDPRNKTWSFVHTLSSTTVTDPLDRERTTETTPDGLIERVVHPDLSERRIEYLESALLGERADYPTAVIDEGGRTRHFLYDELQSESGASDLAGEVYTVTYGWDTDARLAAIDRGGEQRELDYDPWNRLTAVRGGAAEVTYRYDAEGRRIEADGPSGSRRLLVAPALGDGLQSIQMVSDGAGETTRYVWAAEGVVMRSGSDGPVYYLTDGLGSVIALADASGGVVARFAYGAFGQIREESGAAAPPPGTAGDFRFHGVWLEADTGFYQMGVRDYDPRNGLFLTRDANSFELTEPESLHPYLFAYANPQLYRDPTGLFSIVSLNVGSAVRGLLSRVRTLALGWVRMEVKERVTEFMTNMFVDLILGLLPLDPIAGLNDWVTQKSKDLGVRGIHNHLEKGVQNGLCWVFSEAPWLFFEPSMREIDGEAVHDGFSCPVTKNSYPAIIPGTRRPDFYLSQAAPTQSEEGLILGEVKLGVLTYYHTWIRRDRRHPKPPRRRTDFRPGQLDAYLRHAKSHMAIPGGFILMIALNEGRGGRGSPRTRVMKIRIAEKLASAGVFGVMAVLK